MPSPRIDASASNQVAVLLQVFLARVLHEIVGGYDKVGRGCFQRCPGQAAVDHRRPLEDYEGLLVAPCPRFLHNDFFKARGMRSPFQKGSVFLSFPCCLDRGADARSFGPHELPAKAFPGILNVDCGCSRQAQPTLSKSDCWQGMEAASQSFIAANLYRAWTAIGRVHELAPAHPSYVTSFLFPGIDGGRPELEKGRRNAK